MNVNNVYSLKNRVTFSIFVALLVFAVCLLYLRAQAAYNFHEEGVFNDFDVFYLAGQMFWEGRLEDAYNSDLFKIKQEEASGKLIFMPWAYPPQFNIITAFISLFPREISYSLFIGSSMLAFLTSIAYISGQKILIPIFIIYPALLVVITSGQNGMLVASIVSLFCIFMLKENAASGVALGFMIIKPHLAIGLGWLLVLRRDFSLILIIFFIIICTSLFATLFFGIGIWVSFGSALSESSASMQQGNFNLYRMVSVYSSVYTLTDGYYMLSLSLHLLFMIVALAAVTYSCYLNWSLNRILALSCFATLAVSPYAYDYDSVILAVGIALVSQDLIETTNRLEKVAFFVSGWLTTGWGLLTVVYIQDVFLDGEAETFISMGGFGYIIFFILFWIFLSRASLNDKNTSAVVINNNTRWSA